MRQLDLKSKAQKPQIISQIYIQKNLLAQSKYLLEAITGNQALIVTQENIKSHYLNKIANSIQEKRIQLDICILEDGETSKNKESLFQIYDILLQNKHNRTTTLIALGGGVVGDITGFAAATYNRGVNLIQIPTTLLAQVDSSVGGKTAINHPLGKNMIGSFYQPYRVLIDTATLKTLPQREFLAGIAEVVKYSFIGDYDFFEYLEKNIEKLIDRDDTVLEYCIYQSCKNKVAVVSEDEKESSIRALLNFGHTFAHAIEQITQYKYYLHGEAVAMGMLMAIDLSFQMQLINQKTMDRAKLLLNKIQPQLSLKQKTNVEQLINAMSLDKKNTNKTLKFILIKGIGKSFICDSVNTQVLSNILKQYVE